MIVEMVGVLGLVLAQIPTVEELRFHPEALRDRPRVEVRVRTGEANAVYTGVPLREVFEDRIQGPGRMPALRALADAVLLIRGSDGYQAAVSAAAVAMDETGERFLLALERDGEPLGEDQGPVRLIVPGDSERVRWVRGVSSIALVRLKDVRPARSGSTPPGGPPGR
jgi:DMSO/TMAO reductase YedYZ molybdopterin-dependent catalytic subunit